MLLGGRKRQAGALLPETMVAIGIIGILLVVLSSFILFSGQSFAALYNYVDLDGANRSAIDQFTRDVRESNRVTAYATNSISIEAKDLSTITYAYNPTTRTLTRTQNTVARVILHDCDFLTFGIGQRNTVSGSYDIHPAPTPATAKVVSISWKCSRTIFGQQQNSESVQTSRIVIRKQGT